MVVGEVNNGGDLEERNIKAVDAKIPFKGVHPSRGKAIRAEPISALYEQGKVHNFGTFTQFEDQMCEWVQELRSHQIGVMNWFGQ
jgi:phage terminase large subunit-like protein